MKPTKRRWLRLAIAPGLAALAMIGFASQAQANNYNGNCANYPGTFDGTGTVTINNTGTCTLNQAINAAGAVSITSSGAINTAFGITGASVNATTTAGAINAKAITSTSGNLVLTTTGANAVNADLVTANNGSVTVDSGAGATFTNTVQANFGSVGITAKTNISTKKVVAEYLLEIKTTTTGKITVNGGAATSDALKVNNGPMNIVSKDLLTITGLTTSTANEIQLESVLDLKANAIAAGSHVRIVSTTGNVNVTSTINTNNSDHNGNLLIQANNSVKSGAIKINGPTSAGLVQIDVNKGGGNTAFSIGSSATNGVASIDVSGTTGGGTDALYGFRGVFITNGTANSTGGIALTAASKLKLLNTASRSGILWLNAQDGPMTLPGGVAINTNGPSGFFAGQIFLLSKNLIFSGADPTLQATQGQTVAGSSHGVVIATQSITYQGPAGLKIFADGNGLSPVFPTYAYIIPQKSITSTNSNDFRSLFWSSPSLAGVQTADLPLAITGSGASPFTMRANGNDAAIAIRGNDTKIDTGAIALTSNGKINHTITLRDTGPFGDLKGLTLGTINTPTIVIDASAGTGFPGAGNPAGGDVAISSDILTMNGPSYTLKAAGPSSGNGDGGTVRLASTRPMVFSPSSSVTVNADAATSAAGQGNAVSGDPAIPTDRKAIQIYPGAITLNLGTSLGLGQMSLSANGGKGGGNGGTIIAQPSGLNLQTASAVTASAIGSSGNGGEFFTSTAFGQFASQDGLIKVTGAGTGAGGKISGFHFIQKLDVVKYFKIDAGPQADSTTFWGSLTLNSRLCRKTKNGLDDYPPFYWLCVADPTDPNPIELIPPTQVFQYVNASSKVILSNENTQLFVFTDIAGFNQFFSMSEPSTTAGFTFQVPGFATTYVNTVTVINGQTLDETYVREFTIHEIGHAIDYAITISGTSPYLKYVKNDFVHLDYVVVGADKASSSLRSACGPAGPFTNVVDNNNVPVCDVNVLRPDLAGKTNSQILFTLTPYFFTPSQNPTEYLELFAQLYAYKAYSNQLDPLDLPAKTADGLFHNPFFECAGSYAAVYTGGNTSAPTYCDVVPPAWYIPGQ